MTTPRAASVRRYVPTALMAISLAADIGAVALIVALTNAGAGPTIDIYTVGGIVVGAAYAIVGWIIASRRPDNAIGWIFLVIALSQTVAVFAGAYATFGLTVATDPLPFAAVLSWVTVWAWAPGFTLLVTLSVLLFPDGRPPSPRWRPVVWASMAILVLLLVPVAVAAWPYRGTALLGSANHLSSPAIDIATTLQTVGILATPFVAAASIAGMVVRFRRAGPTERQQLKWFTYAAIPEVAFIVSSGFVSASPIVAVVASVLLAPLLPVAAAIAILRYRLFEIDRIVSRTIGWAVVTAILVATFAGAVIALEAALSGVTQGQTLAVAASTLAASALFQPVRRRVQSAVDRRFDRTRYDAEQTVAALAATLRDEVDLEVLGGAITDVVQRSVAPASTGLWLRHGVVR